MPDDAKRDKNTPNTVLDLLSRRPIPHWEIKAQKWLSAYALSGAQRKDPDTTSISEQVAFTQSGHNLPPSLEELRNQVIETYNTLLHRATSLTSAPGSVHRADVMAALISAPEELRRLLDVDISKAKITTISNEIEKIINEVLSCGQSAKHEQHLASRLIPYVNENRRHFIISNILNSESYYLAKETAIDAIPDVPRPDRTGLQERIRDDIQPILAGGTRLEHRQVAAISWIRYSPEESRGDLIRSALNNELMSIAVRKMVMKNIKYAARCDQPSLRGMVAESIMTHIRSSKPGHEYIIDSIKYTGQEDCAKIIKSIFESPNFDNYLKVLAIDSIKYATPKSRPSLYDTAKKMVLSIINDSEEYTFIRAHALAHIEILDEKDRAQMQAKIGPLIKDIFEDHEGFESIKKETVFCIRYADDNGQKGLCQSAKDLEINLSRQSPLHNIAPSKGAVEFEKTGSNLYVGQKSSGVSVRVIPLSSFTLWMKAYLSEETWKSAGFEYVPVEPIMSVAAAEPPGCEIAVQTINLPGKSLHESIHTYSRSVQDKIRDQQKRIVATLQALGIKHGHLHNNNFVLAPRLTKGRPDPSKTPRIYVIDFDEARVTTVSMPVK